jgi:hypothetical protein
VKCHRDEERDSDLKKETTLARRQKCSSNTELTSFRQARTLTRLIKGIGFDINHSNQWLSVERAKGRGPKLGMQQHYADVLLLLRSSVTHQRSNTGSHDQRWFTVMTKGAKKRGRFGYERKKLTATRVVNAIRTRQLSPV